MTLSPVVQVLALPLHQLLFRSWEQQMGGWFVLAHGFTDCIHSSLAVILGSC